MDKERSKYKLWLVRCKSRGIDNTISFQEYKDLQNEKYCYYTGVKLVVVSNTHDTPDNQLTIDRKDAKLGYIQGNVVACANSVNRFKNSYFEMVNCWEKQAGLLKEYNLYQQIKAKIEPVKIEQKQVSKFRQILKILFNACSVRDKSKV